jgi:alanyl-tRNA synthetase
MTIRMDLADPDTLVFRSRVREQWRAGDRWEVVLEETYFYPESGGQLHDVGTLAGAPVLDVRLEGKEVVHVIDRPVPTTEVEGRIDAERRHDHRCQHTGQHILSRAFLDVAGAPTVSSRLGSACTIDLPLEAPDPELIDRVERAAQRIVDDDVPVRIHFFRPDEPIPFELRKEPGEHATIRVIEIEGRDATPCGGTHCRRSGEVGLVKILAAERHKKGLCRITFACGPRAVEDYRRKHGTVRTLVGTLMAPEGEIVDAVERLRRRLEDGRKTERRLWKEIVAARARRLREEAPTREGRRIVRHAASDLPAEHAPALARAVAAEGETVALVGCPGDPAIVAVAATPGVAPHLGRLLEEVLSELGGKGGGGPTFAQGAVPSREVARALDLLAARLAVPPTA